MLMQPVAGCSIVFYSSSLLLCPGRSRGIKGISMCLRALVSEGLSVSIYRALLWFHTMKLDDYILCDGFKSLQNLQRIGY